MTESEWLSSADPRAMLSCFTAYRPPELSHFLPISDRKLRLFAAACYLDVEEAAIRITGDNITRAILDSVEWAETGVAPAGTREMSSPADIHDDPLDHATSAMSWSSYHRGLRTPEQLKHDQAALLRDIVGNPFRPVTLPRTKADVLRERQNAVGGGCCDRFADQIACDCLEKASASPSWLTWNDGTISHLARECYEQRVGRVCSKCEGSGHADNAQFSCSACHGSCTISDGTLCPQRLAVLADALEDAGCDNEDILRHCRGEERCFACEVERKSGNGITVLRLAGASVQAGDGKASPIHLPECRNCKGTGWRPLRAPHVRGCWVLNLLLGKE